MSTVQEDIQDLMERVQILEDEFTMSLGFTIPETLSMEEAFQLLTTIQDPLRTEIKTKLLTRSYALSEYDIRWLVLGVLIRFGFRFGKMRDVALSIANDFYDTMDKTSDRVHDLMKDPGRIPATRFGYFRSCVAALCGALTEWDEKRLKLMTKENFVMFNGNDWVGGNNHTTMDETFSSLTNLITSTANNYCRELEGQAELPDVVRGLSHCEHPNELRAFKENLAQRALAIKIFNEILDEF